jgi:hypothetical protein
MPMPRGEAYKTELEAVAIVRSEYERAGWSVGPPLSKTEERRQGCDLLAEHAETGDRAVIEVKGWGEPLRQLDGAFCYPADINAQQHQRALHDDLWRLEIVANLSAARVASGRPERLRLSAADVRERAIPVKLAVPLDGLEYRIRDAESA